MSEDFEKYAKELSEKVANIPPYNLHMMEERGINLDKPEMRSVLNDLQSFVDGGLSELKNYEKWLEENGGPNKTR